jgi:ABC-type multidrug transport system fused ATPase/permease subunit
VLDVASRLPDGLDTQVGERGAQLSGGERQRVAIARALLRDAAIVILDEPSSGLDAGSEKRLCGSVLDALRGRTVLLITHDPSLAASADRVLTLRSGRIVTEEESVPEAVR